jgi:hypothetical protein
MTSMLELRTSDSHTIEEMRLAFVSLLVTMAIACSPSGPTARLDANFVLAPGESARVTGADLSIRFIGVQGDSRCPADVVCIQGGDAIVRVDVLPSTGGVKTYDLHTGNSQPVRHGDVSIALVELAPYPFASRPTQPGDYRATLRVTR